MTVRQYLDYHSLKWGDPYKIRPIHFSMDVLGFQMYTLVYPEVVKDAESGLSLKDFMGDDG